MGVNDKETRTVAFIGPDEETIKLKKELLREAIKKGESLKNFVISSKFTRPFWTKKGEERCGACLFIYGGTLCLLLDWFVSPDMKSCNHFERPP